MALSPSDFVFRDEDGGVLKSGDLHALFDAARVGDSTDYRLVTIINTGSLSLSSGKVWLTRSGGAALALALANGPSDYFADGVTPSGLTYSTASSESTGISLGGTLGASQRVRVAVRRVLSSAQAADPQTARLYIGGTSPY